MVKKVLVKYSSNNSGGSWWLSDKDWQKLEDAGWTVVWGGMVFCHSELSFHKNNEPICATNKECHGHIRCKDMKESAKDRYLGAVAKECFKEFKSIGEGLEEFERITGQKVTEEGCNCCGAPHSFSWSSSGCINGICNCIGPHKDYHYCSGEDCLQYLFPNKRIPKSLREALEKEAR